MKQFHSDSGTAQSERRQGKNSLHKGDPRAQPDLKEGVGAFRRGQGVP